MSSDRTIKKKEIALASGTVAERLAAVRLRIAKGNSSGALWDDAGLWSDFFAGGPPPPCPPVVTPSEWADYLRALTSPGPGANRRTGWLRSAGMTRAPFRIVAMASPSRKEYSTLQYSPKLCTMMASRPRREVVSPWNDPAP
jgi:hypothetical protein